MARLAVGCRVFPLVEVEDGCRWRVTFDPSPEPVGPYLHKQGRFRHLTDQHEAFIQREVDARWQAIEQRVRETGLMPGQR
jgi:pyruvate/2-oxoacid:ferredoxin oxidoreductase beta subunit